MNPTSCRSIPNASLRTHGLTGALSALPGALSALVTAVSAPKIVPESTKVRRTNIRVIRDFMFCSRVRPTSISMVAIKQHGAALFDCEHFCQVMFDARSIVHPVLAYLSDSQSGY